MYGVPAGLDLTFFCGDCLTQLCLGQYQVQLKFGRGGTIAVEGSWQLKDATGDLLAHVTDCEVFSESAARLYVLLGATVTRSTVDPPVSFTLFFDNGISLTVIDDSDRYESFSIQPGNVFV
jgi:Family of unknown function (DUF6188)